jgi:predicted esterase
MVLVSGERDESLDQVRLKAQAAQLRERGQRCIELSFAGGHRLDSPTLQRLASHPPGGHP